MRFKDLSGLKRPEPQKIMLATLPQDITMSHYARAKAFKINELVRTIHADSFEWYGFTLAAEDNPELILDIGLPKNDQNLLDYTTIGPQRIAEFQESLPDDTLINGWIHSHGALNYRHFSHTDEKNHLAVLDFIDARLRRPVAKKEVVIQDLVLLEKDRFAKEDLARGSVSIIADGPITAARIMETVYGSFCYSIVIGDEGWHEQEIIFKERGILSGHTMTDSIKADIILVDTGRSLTQFDIQVLADEVEEKIQPNTDPPPEIIERM
ncbi:MAG: hypothetical protein ISS65_12840 [Desulfobacterales bacterium]|uniref:JAB domain-containing protein n=1 Tax=Candidatus Desulfatibia profunda TaxID=2841695 RepID=A0A8J6NYC4_9BACT|nr:hypothetical protein [Candidatus Desulfatibia profunda]MBL7181072.1 hypothetical protein [Desulfobacterales bacterium]